MYFLFFLPRVQVSAEAPELPGLVADMQERLAELRNKITPLWKLVNEVFLIYSYTCTAF